MHTQPYLEKVHATGLFAVFDCVAMNAVTLWFLNFFGLSL